MARALRDEAASNLYHETSDDRYSRGGAYKAAK